MRSRYRTSPNTYVAGGKALQTTLQSAWTVYKMGSGEPCSGMLTTAIIGTPAKPVLSPTWVDVDSIVDNPHGLGQISPCRHTKTKYGNGMYNTIQLMNGVAGDKLATYQWAIGMRANPINAGGLTLLQNNAYDVYQRSCRAWRDMEPQYKNLTGFSGSNFIHELRELKPAPQQILRLSRKLRDAAAKIFRHDNHKTLAELQLANAYAFQPLVRDVSVLSLTLGEAGRALKRFNDQGKQWNTFHYSEQIPVEDLFVDGGTYCQFQKKRGLYCASVRNKWEETSQDAVGNFMQFYGLTLSPQQIWEMIPFSFLVDQVYTVGKTLERLSRTPVSKVQRGMFVESLKLETINLLCMKQQYNLRYFSGGCDPQGIDPGKHHPIAFSKKSSYDRYISLPPALGGVPVPQLKLPTIANLVNDVALLRANIGWRPSRRGFNGLTD